MVNKLLTGIGLSFGALFGAAGDGHSETATLQTIAYVTSDAVTAPQAIKTRVQFHVPKKPQLIVIEKRDAPAGYVNTRPYTVAAVSPVADPATASNPDADWRKVTGSRVNLRAGPGTGNPVVGKLTQGMRAIALDRLDNGWVQIEVPELGVQGYMSGQFLTAAN